MTGGKSMPGKQWREGRRDYTDAQKRALIYEQRGGKKKGINPASPEDAIF